MGDALFAFKLNYNTNKHGGANLFNGNISETEWRTANDDSSLHWYRYSYDALNRLTDATDNFGKLKETLNYDKNGNITDLVRLGHIVGGTTVPNITNAQHFGVMDNLGYTYGTDSNKLLKVADTANKTYGFRDGTNTGDDYAYDVNGNMVTDLNKGISAINYNYMNLPKLVTFGNGNISYIYDATSVKLSKKVVETGKPDTYTYYAGNYVYENSSLKFFNHPEGYVDAENGFGYVYQYKDHLGNIRLSYKDVSLSSTPSLEIQEENNYYPFGLEHKGYNNVVTSANPAQNYKFSGKEYQDELGLNVYDFGARVYDPAVPRFWQVDPMADERQWISPYNYVQNNPLLRIDPTGMLDTHYEDEFGNTLADTNDGNNATVVISSQNADTFKEDFNNTSVMHQDGAAKNAEWIGKYGEGMVAQEGATVQSWAVEAMGHDANYQGVAIAGAGLGLAAGESALKGATFRLFNNKGTNFSPKLYTSGWLGGSAGRIKTYGGGSKALSVFGKFLGAYNAYSVNEQYRSGQISKGTMQIEQASNLFSTFGGIYGASWGVGWELGKAYGPSKWYGNDETKWFD